MSNAGQFMRVFFYAFFLTQEVFWCTGFYHETPGAEIDSRDFLLSIRDLENEIVNNDDLENEILDNDDDKDLPFECPSDRFRCSYEDKCIYSEWLCDGDTDCSDGSDEFSCPQLKSCEDREFRCENGRCLPRVWLCDGDDDCLDGSDEKNCTVTRSKKCPIGFVYSELFNQCWSLPGNDQLMTQKEAAFECSRRHEDAQLLVITNKQQDFTITELLKIRDMSRYCDGFWTSGRRLNPFQPFNWQYSTSSKYSNSVEEILGLKDKRNTSLTYTNWAIGRPKTAFGLKENCIFIDPTNKWKWNQRKCDDQLCVMCQIDLL